MTIIRSIKQYFSDNVKLIPTDIYQYLCGFYYDKELKMAEFLKNDTELWVFVKVLGSGAFGIVELWENESTIEKIGLFINFLNKRKIQIIIRRLIIYIKY